MKGAVEFIVNPGVKPRFNPQFKAGDEFFLATPEDVHPGKVIKVERGYLNDTQVRFGYLYTTDDNTVYFQTEARTVNIFKTMEEAVRAWQKINYYTMNMEEAWKNLDAIVKELRVPQ